MKRVCFSKRYYVIVAIVLALTLSLEAAATYVGEVETNYVEFDGGYDTLSYTQAEYESLTTASKAQTDKIEDVLIAYLSLSRASARKPNLYDPTAMIAASAKNTTNTKYYLQYNEYIGKIYSAMNGEIIKDAISFHNFSIKDSTTNKVIASIVEEYRYFDNIYKREFYRLREYTFNLINYGETWKIVSISTNDPWELEDGFSYQLMDVDAAVKQAVSSSVELENISMYENTKLREEAQRTENTTLYKWEYDVEAAVSYAAAHFAKNTNNNDFGYNYYYEDTDGDGIEEQYEANCQNFASQCVWAGLGGTDGTAYGYPMVNGTNGGLDSRIWRHGYYFNQPASTPTNEIMDSRMLWTWDNVKGFANYINTSSIYKKGPYGWLHLGTLHYAEAGDIIWFSARNTTPTISEIACNFEHAMFVTGVDETVPGIQRTQYDIVIAAHSNHTNSAQLPLWQYVANRPDSNFAVARIRGAHYDTPQT